MVKAKEFSDFPCAAVISCRMCAHEKTWARQFAAPMRCDSVFVLQAAPAGPYFRLPRSSTVMVVVFGIAVMSLETLIVPSNMAFTSVL